MKKLLGCLFAIIIFAINIIPCYAAGPSLSISANDYTVSVGDTVTVSVSLSAGSNLKTLSFNVNYNPSEFEYLAGSASMGSMFDSCKFNVPSAGVATVSATSTNVATNGGTVVSMKFRVLDYGGKFSVSVVGATDENDASVRVTPSGMTLSCSHARMVWETRNTATCQSEGAEYGECICGYAVTREIPKSAHTYTSSTIKKPATCTETGIEVGACTVCGEEGVESKIPVTGHKYTEWVVIQEATADTMGVKERVCQVCGEKKTQMVPTLIEGIDPEDITGNEDDPTETTTEFQPIYTPEPSTNNYFEIETETTTQANGIFGDAVGSDIAIIVVIALAVLVVVILIMYMMLIIRQKKR